MKIIQYIKKFESQKQLFSEYEYALYPGGSMTVNNEVKVFKGKGRVNEHVKKIISQVPKK